jgi:hypothetical protein
MWIVPLAVFLLVSMAVVVRQLDYLTGIVLGLVIIYWVSKRPDLGLLGLIIFLPFQQVTFSLLFHFGLSLQLTRQGGSWKEALAVGVAIAGFKGFREARRKLDTLDKIALAFIGIVLVFALFPQLFADSAPIASDVRSLAFRQTAGFVILFLGARHANLGPDFGRIAAKTVMIVGGLVAAIAVYEFFLSDSFNTFMVNTVEFPKYKFYIFNEGNPFIQDIRRYGSIGGAEYTRVGSVLFDFLNLGFYLLLPFAFAVERTVRDGLRSMAGAVLLLTGSAIIFTQTRAAVIGALIIGLIAVRPAAGKSVDRRLQYGFVLSIIFVLALPVAAYTGLTERSTSALSGDEESATSHWDSLNNGIQGVVENPIGRGLGTSAGVGQRFTDSAFITENYYLQMGIEIGVIGMIMFILLTITVIRYLNRAARRVPDLPLGAMRLAMIGLAIGAVLLHTWTEFAVSWTAWGLAGAVLGYSERIMQAEDAAVDQPVDTAPIARPHLTF